MLDSAVPEALGCTRLKACVAREIRPMVAACYLCHCYHCTSAPTNKTWREGIQVLLRVLNSDPELFVYVQDNVPNVRINAAKALKVLLECEKVQSEYVVRVRRHCLPYHALAGCLVTLAH